MKTIRMSVVLASMVGAATFVLAVPAAMSASVWSNDYSIAEGGGFYTGERISTSQKTPATGTEGQGFDLFNSGDGIKVADYQKAYMGTSLGSEASSGWDTFRVGEGDPLP